MIFATGKARDSAAIAERPTPGVCGRDVYWAGRGVAEMAASASAAGAGFGRGRPHRVRLSPAEHRRLSRRFALRRTSIAFGFLLPNP